MKWIAALIGLIGCNTTIEPRCVRSRKVVLHKTAKVATIEFYMKTLAAIPQRGYDYIVEICEEYEQEQTDGK